MSLGGGVFLTQNKVAPGVYINFMSAARSMVSVAERGTAALALELDWGPDDEVFTVENGDMLKNCRKIFGYDYTHAKMKGLRDLFLHAKTLYAYRLNGGVKAANAYATAKYSGTRGNALKIAIAESVDAEDVYEVSTLLDDVVVDVQTVSAVSELTANDFVVFKADMTLEETAGTALTGGTNAASIAGTAYQTFLEKIESYRFNVLGCLSAESTVKALYAAFTRRMRDEVGVKFQTVLYDMAADYEGIISLKNAVTDTGENAASLVYWLTGKCAGCAVNQSNTNQVYDGEFTVNTNYTQSQLEQLSTAGHFLLHKVGDAVRVFRDVNSFVSVTVNKGQDFGMNQVIRVLDQMGNDIASLFARQYLGLVQNNTAGRTALWNDIVSYNQQLRLLGAIEEFDTAEIVVEEGDTRDSVVITNPVVPVMAMEKLYMTIIVR